MSDIQHTINETLPFLTHSREDVRRSALHIFLSVLATENGPKTLVEDRCVLPSLIEALEAEESENVRSLVVTLLANLIGDVPEAISKLDIPRLSDAVLRSLKETSSIETHLILFSNLTTNEDACMEFLRGDPAHHDEEGMRMRVLLDEFLRHPPREGEQDEWQHVASILCNTTTVEPGRRVVLRQSTGYFQRLLPQINSSNPIRRRGVVAAIKNCLFDDEFHFWLVNEVGILVPLLTPLIGPNQFTAEETQGMEPALLRFGPDKQIEPERDVVALLLECIVLLCQKKTTRAHLRSKKLYPIIRKLDDSIEEDEEIGELIYKIVNFLQRDEEGESKSPLEIAPTVVSAEQVRVEEPPTESLVEQITRKAQANNTLEEID